MNDVNWVGLLDVAELCAQIAARSSEMFRYTGRAVMVASPGYGQRFWATASHRHAWHVELAVQRSPTVVVVDHDDRVGQIARELVGPDGSAAGADDRLGDWWQRSRRELIELMETARSDLSEELDPNTWRLIDLVGSDLESLGTEYRTQLRDPS